MRMTQRFKKIQRAGISVQHEWSAQTKHVPERREQFEMPLDSRRSVKQMDAFPTRGRVRESGMTMKVKDEILHDHNQDGIDRRGFLKCMAWAGTGALCVMQGGVLKSYALGTSDAYGAKASAGELSFVQISDSHMGFNKPANTDVVGTLKAAVGTINGLQVSPEF